MICKYCNSKKAVLDVESNTYMCKSCAKEIKRENREPEELNGFSLLVIFLLMRIPLISSLLVAVVCTKETEYKYRKAVAYNYVSHLAVMIGIVCIIGFRVDFKQDEIVEDIAMYTMTEPVSRDLITDNIETFKVEMQKRAKLNLDVNIDSKGDESYIVPSDMKYLDGAIISYDNTVLLINELCESEYIVLIQTGSTKSKFGKKCYYNVGSLISTEVVPELNEPFKCEFVNNTAIDSYINEDKDKIQIDCSALFTQSKFVYSMKKKESYRVELLKNESGEFTGVCFTVVED